MSDAPSLDPSYLDAIKASEGFSPTAQWDYKQNTNGYGTQAQYPGETIDPATAQQRYDSAISAAAAHVDSVNPNTPPGVRAALTSLTYNAGPGWSSAGLGDLVRAGDWSGAKDRFMQYVNAGGQFNPGLAARREREAAWFDPTATTTAQGPQPLLSTPTAAPTVAQSPAQPPAYPWSLPGAPAASSVATAPVGQAPAQGLAQAPAQLTPQQASMSDDAFSYRPMPVQPMQITPPGMHPNLQLLLASLKNAPPSVRGLYSKG